MEVITADELAYHNQVTAEVQALQQQSRDLAERAKGVASSWARYLSDKYKLGAGGIVNDKGEIVRTAAQPTD
jgi:hypothetical protein